MPICFDELEFYNILLLLYIYYIHTYIIRSLKGGLIPVCLVIDVNSRSLREVIHHYVVLAPHFSASSQKHLKAHDRILNKLKCQFPFQIFISKSR